MRCRLAIENQTLSSGLAVLYFMIPPFSLSPDVKVKYNVFGMRGRGA